MIPKFYCKLKVSSKNADYLPETLDLTLKEDDYYTDHVDVIQLENKPATAKISGKVTDT